MSKKDPKEAPLKEGCHYHYDLLDQEHGRLRLRVRVVAVSGVLWIGAEGYYGLCEDPGHGYPIMVELYEGRFRILVWNGLNIAEPVIVDMEETRDGCEAATASRPQANDPKDALIRRLSQELRYAGRTLERACHCGSCGPCRRRRAWPDLIRPQ